MAEAVKITVTLQPDIEDFVRDQTTRGAFASSSDYIETVLRERYEHERAREQLDAELQKGIDDVRAGRVMSVEEAFDSIYEELGTETSGTMKVVFTREARRDLSDIGRYLLSQNPGRALTYMEDLRATCLELALMPDAFEVLEISTHSGIRRRVLAPYLIFYRVEDPEVKILRIIHGARDYLRILGPQI